MLKNCPLFVTATEKNLLMCSKNDLKRTQQAIHNKHYTLNRCVMTQKCVTILF